MNHTKFAFEQVSKYSIMYISTHDKECIKLHKYSKGLVVSIWSQMRGRSDTRREWMYENARRRKFTSACRILNCFKVEYVWIEHVDVCWVMCMVIILHCIFWFFMSLLKIILTMIMHFYVWFLSYLHPLVLPLILHLHLALHKNRNF